MYHDTYTIMADFNKPIPLPDHWLISECRYAMLTELVRHELIRVDRERAELLICDLHTDFARSTRPPITSFKLQRYFSTALDSIPFEIFRESEDVRRLFPAIFRQGLRAARSAAEIDGFIQGPQKRK